MDFRCAVRNRDGVAVGGDGDLQSAATYVRRRRQRLGWVADLHRRQPGRERMELHRGLQGEPAQERDPDAAPVGWAETCW